MVEHVINCQDAGLILKKNKIKWQAGLRPNTDYIFFTLTPYS